MKIAIYGSAVAEESVEKAKQIGLILAKEGHTIITGGCPGIPYEASRAAEDEGGHTIAYSPAIDLKEHDEKFKFPTEGFTEFKFLSKDFEHTGKKQICLKYRNILSAVNCDAAIIISGRIGTMNEFTILHELGKKIGILEDSGGITKTAIKALLDDANKETKAEVIWEKDPAKLVERITE